MGVRIAQSNIIDGGICLACGKKEIPSQRNSRIKCFEKILIEKIIPTKDEQYGFYYSFSHAIMMYDFGSGNKSYHDKILSALDIWLPFFQSDREEQRIETYTRPDVSSDDYHYTLPHYGDRRLIAIQADREAEETISDTNVLFLATLALMYMFFKILT